MTNAQRSRLMKFLGWTEDDIPLIKGQITKIMGPEGKLYKPLRRVGDGYGHPPGPGAGNQVDGVAASAYASLLFDDDTAWENAIIRMRSLMAHAVNFQQAKFDTGHGQRFPFCAAVIYGAEEWDQLGNWFTAYDRWSNTHYLHQGPGNGVRPQFRAFGHAFEYAWMLERLGKLGIDIPANLLPPKAMRKLAMDYGAVLFSDRGDQGFINRPREVYADPVWKWGFVPADSEHAIGDSTQPFHFTWVVPIAMLTAYRYGAKMPKDWTTGVRLIARWCFDYLYDPESMTFPESGARHTFTPSKYAAMGGRFRDWPEDLKAVWGSRQYHALPLLLALGNDPTRIKAADRQKLIASRKDADREGEIEPAVVWEAERKARG